MRYFPIFLDLEDRLAVVVGGSPAAARKARQLHDAGARLRVVAPTLEGDFAAWLAGSGGAHLVGGFAPPHLDGAQLVVADSGDAATDAAVAKVARLRHLPVNVVDNPTLSSFVMPAIVDRSPIIVAVSSAGTAPVLARLLKARIEGMLPASLGRLAEIAGALRPEVGQRLPTLSVRRRFWAEMVSGPVADLVHRGLARQAIARLRRELAHWESGERAGAGAVYYIDVGAGDADLLTLRALRRLQEADVVSHDLPAPAAVLALARADARRLAAPAASAADAALGLAIGRQLRDLARTGAAVVRLEDRQRGHAGAGLELLRGAGIPVEIVPAVSPADSPAPVPAEPQRAA